MLDDFLAIQTWLFKSLDGDVIRSISFHIKSAILVHYLLSLYLKASIYAILAANNNPSFILG